MKNWSFTFLLIFCQLIAYNQTMHNFTVTDSDGNVHKLYETYLNNGKTVVIKFFFTTCPPCIALAPAWQQKYTTWGSGMHDVQFLEPTTISSDNTAKVKTYKTTHGLTMPGIPVDGNAPMIVDPFKNGAYGGWYGTPSFAVIAPNKSIQFPVQFSQLDAAIAATGAQMPGSQTVPATINLAPNAGTFNVGNGDIKFFVKPKNANTPKLEITKNAQGTYSFQYPSTQYPEMTEPIVIMESLAPDFVPGISAQDLVIIQKYILGIESFPNNWQKIAADVNNDAKVTAQDIVNIRKLILGISTEFPNNVPSYISIPAFNEVIAAPGTTATLNFQIVKMGNVN
jgi:thiol-disulfide isomerase/thioredoxin